MKKKWLDKLFDEFFRDTITILCTVLGIGVIGLLIFFEVTSPLLLFFGLGLCLILLSGSLITNRFYMWLKSSREVTHIKFVYNWCIFLAIMPCFFIIKVFSSVVMTEISVVSNEVSDYSSPAYNLVWSYYKKNKKLPNSDKDLQKNKNKGVFKYFKYVGGGTKAIIKSSSKSMSFDDRSSLLKNEVILFVGIEKYKYLTQEVLVITNQKRCFWLSKDEYVKYLEDKITRSQ